MKQEDNQPSRIASFWSSVRPVLDRFPDLGITLAAVNPATGKVTRETRLPECGAACVSVGEPPCLRTRVQGSGGRQAPPDFGSVEERDQAVAVTVSAAQALQQAQAENVGDLAAVQWALMERDRSWGGPTGAALSELLQAMVGLGYARPEAQRIALVSWEAVCRSIGGAKSYISSAGTLAAHRRDARIALQAGGRDTAEAVARREGVSDSHVRRLWDRLPEQA